MALANKTFQDLITFTRSTSGSYVGSDGYLVTSTPVANYLTYSNQLENGVWTKNNSFVQQNLAINSQDFDLWPLGAGVSVAANSTIAPDGTLTADRITFTAGGAAEFVRRTATLTVGVVYTASVYAQIASGTPTFIFDVGNGAAASTAQTPTVAWQRFTFTFTFSGANQWVDLESSGAGTIAFWGFQLVQGSVPGNYQATTATTLPVLYPDYNGARRARVWIPSASGNSGAVRLLASISPATIGATYTVSVYVKSYGRRWVFLTAPDASSPAYNAWFDLQNGVVGTKGANVISATITAAGNEYYRITATSVATSITQYVFLSATDADNSTTVTAAGNGIYIANVQLAPGDSAGPYYETTNNATYTPRFDYDPVTRAAKGLLVEESRANLLTYSEQFNNTAWTAAITGASISSNVLIAPDNTQSADKLIENNANSTHNIVQTITYANQTYVFSVYVAKASERNAMVYMYTASGFAGAVLNVANGTASIFSGSIAGTGATVVDAGAYWRVSVAALMPAAVGSANIYTISGTAASYLGDGTSGIYLWGAQLEVGAFATSYIPTGISQVTRAADVTSVNTLSPWFNSVAGTLYAEYDAYAPLSGAAFGVAVLNDGTASNRTYLFLGGGTAAPSLIVTSAGAAQANINNSAIPANTTAKTAGTYAVNDFAVASNAGTVATDVSGALPVGLSKLDLGGFLSGTFLNGHLRRITYYPQRLSNAQLQSITA